MERESERYFSGEVYEDKPKPGRGLLAFLAAGTVIPIAMFGYQAMVKYSMSQNAFLGAVLGFGAMLVFFLYCVYHTSYKAGRGKFKARCGIFSSTLDLSDIESIKRVRFVRQVIGTSWRIGGKYCGRCNRLMNCVAISTPHEKLFISPSDPEAFIAALRERMHGTST